jgi:hypothetical protein
MSIFGSIMGAIFGSKAGATSSSSGPSSSTAAPGKSGTTSGQSGGAPPSTVDVEAVLNDLAAKNKEKLNWRNSIVDLMKLLKLDSSLSSRKELAKELGYTSDNDDSAAMNIWLHKQVMRKLSENGGKVPADLH